MIRPLAAIAMVLLATAGAAGQPPARPPATPPGLPPLQPPRPPPREQPISLADIPVPNLEARLGALSPARPADYYLLAEDLAAERQAPGARDLARHLLVLAVELDRKAPRPGGTASSACLALAALANTQSERRWLRAIAAQFDPAAQTADSALRVRVDPPRVSQHAALQVGSALSFLRAAEGRRALSILDRPGVWPVIEHYDAVLSPQGELGGAAKIRRWAEEWPACPECRNKRTIARLEPGAPANSPPNSPANRTILCPTCGGIPGPRLTPDELIGQLRLESVLLRGAHRLWSAQILSDAAEPLRDPNPDDLPILFRVDPRAVLWRAGRFEADPAAKPAPEPAAAGAAAAPVAPSGG